MGNFRDPLVGRDILYGIILGVIWLLIFGFASILMRRVGGPPDTFRLDYLMGGRHTLAAPLARIPGAIVGALLFFFVFLILRALLRKEWLAAVGFVLIWTFLKMLTSTYLAIEVPAWALLYSLAAFVLLRYGLIALTLGMLIVDLVSSIPFSSDFSAWYGSTTLFSLVAVIALAVCSFYNALGGQKLWTIDLFG